MDSIEFIAIIAVLAGILTWYIHNVRSGSDGHAGLFALRQDVSAPETGPERRLYSPITHAKNQTPDHDTRQESGDNHDRQSHRKFHRREEARYRVKDKMARYRPQKATPPS